MIGLQKNKSAIDEALSVVEDVGQRLPDSLDAVTVGLLALGALNWLGRSLLNFDAVQAVAGARSVPARILYGVLGLSGVYVAVRGAREVAS